MTDRIGSLPPLGRRPVMPLESIRRASPIDELAAVPNREPAKGTPPAPVLVDGLGRTRSANDLAAENDRLRAENAKLLDRVALLEDECRRLLGQA